MARLTILLPPERDRCGRAVLVSGGGDVLLGPFRVLGTASPFVSQRMGNPTHDRLLPFGDPPCGSYVVASSLPPGSIHERRPGRFGRLGALVLEATDGEALDARSRGREHIVLHGGSLDRLHRLRRTRGGLRVPDQPLVALFDAINRTQVAGDALSAIEVVDVSSGFETEPALPAAHRRARRRPSAASLSAPASVVAITAMAMCVND